MTNATQVLECAGQAGALRELSLGPRAAEFASTGQRPVFPIDAVMELACDLGRSVDCYFPPREAEAAAVAFVARLAQAGWKVYQPGACPHN
jgi:hypothetical protein